jgi:transposase
MVKPPCVLPSDAATLTSLVEELFSTVVEKERQIGQLSSQIEWLKRQLFGRRSEKLDPNQLALGLGEPPSVEPVIESQAPAEAPGQPQTRSRPGHGRKALPRHLERRRIEYHPPEAELCCPECQAHRVRMGEEVSEQLEYVPSSLLVLEHVRIKYACRHCQGHVLLGALPGTAPIAKGLPGPGLLAYVLTSKYVDHLPLYRLENSVLAREGIELSRSTQCDWVAACRRVLTPIVEVMKRELLSSGKIHTDDTTVPVLDKDRQTTKTGYLWAYCGDEDHEHIVFDYTPSHSRAGPVAFLEGFQGYLQADAYAGYGEIYAGGKVIEVGCWAHARRKFFEAQSSDGRRSHIVLGFIRRLYEVESQARSTQASPEQRRILRQKASSPVLGQLQVWLEENKGEVAPKSPMGQAIGYARSNWQALTRYLDNGVLEIDNNTAERALRRVALGRKNWLFAGSDEGGHRAATIYSLVASCARLQIDPYEYLRDVLGRIATHPPAEIGQLTPKAWKAARASRAVAA